mmetsp:Transcript_46537/g.99251  ORF Transcript_46537/g.99251 Transcript_46537/m.99251 type:complete len:208 (+) Transcript_46537:1075-1698(+)
MTTSMDTRTATTMERAITRGAITVGAIRATSTTSTRTWGRSTTPTSAPSRSSETGCASNRCASHAGCAPSRLRSRKRTGRYTAPRACSPSRALASASFSMLSPMSWRRSLWARGQLLPASAAKSSSSARNSTVIFSNRASKPACAPSGGPPTASPSTRHQVACSPLWPPLVRSAWSSPTYHHRASQASHAPVRPCTPSSTLRPPLIR